MKFSEAWKKKADAKPSAGIYYYVYLNSNWERMSFRYTEYPSLSHVEAWKDYIIPRLQESYNIQDVNSLIPLYRSMPRGRIDTMDEKYYEIYYGNDIPSALDITNEQGNIINDFNLSGFAARGAVNFFEVGHEKMVPEHQTELQKVLGIQIQY